MKRDFTLTEEQISNGLTDKDFSAYAGIPVVTFDMDAFPYWDKVSRSEELTDSESAARAQKIHMAWKQAGFGSKKDAPLTAALSREAANRRLPCYFAGGVERRKASKPTRFFAGHIVRGQYEQSSVTWNAEASSSNDLQRLVVGTGTLDEEVDVSKKEILLSAAVLREPAGSAPQDFWARYSEIPKDRLAWVPKDGMHRLANDLHEKRHLRQVSLVSDSCVPSYYSELDCDYFAHFTLCRAEVGADTRKADLACRYLELLLHTPDYWIAPALDSLLRKKYPNSFWQVHETVMEIRVRLAMEAAQVTHRHITSGEIHRAVACWDMRPRETDFQNISPMDIGRHNDAYNDWRRAQFAKQPEVPLTLLRGLVDRDAFDAPFSALVARKIVQSAALFNPALVEEPQARKKVERQESLTLGSSWAVQDPRDWTKSTLG